MFARLIVAAALLCAQFAVAASQDRREPTITRSARLSVAVVDHEFPGDPLRIEYTVEKYRVRVLGDDSYGTRMAVGFRIRAAEDASRYVFVQFIRGGVFFSSAKDGGVTRLFTVLKPHEEGLRTFFFSEWTIDTEDNDPAYWTSPGFPRTHSYVPVPRLRDAWSAIPGATLRRAPGVLLAVTDRPPLAFRGEMGVQSVALEFKTCLLRERDVPASRPWNVQGLMSSALYCFEWKSVNVYDYALRDFRSDLSVDDVFPDIPGLRPEIVSEEQVPPK